ncbi:MAG TPA: DUF885 family protein [Terriglobales bacterium]|nr:DUF885 family protein [Terriglobales bacterium]
MKPLLALLTALCLSVTCPSRDSFDESRGDSLDKLANDFWTWRAIYQPFSNDDIPRIERPRGLRRSWSAQSVARQKADLAAFEARWRKLDPAARPIPHQVDYQLMGSALARVHWELDLNRRWQRDPTFYLDQTLTAAAEDLLPATLFDEVRSHELISRFENIPLILEEAQANLQQPAAPFARLAIDSLADIRAELQVVARDVAPLLPPDQGKELAPAIAKASTALESYRAWLQQHLLATKQQTAVGREAYRYFFQKVALYPFTPEALLELARSEWARSVACEQTEHDRNRALPELKMFATLDDQLRRTNEMEIQVRQFLTAQSILTVPADFPHYTVRGLPAYLAALGDFGELDDFTGPSRLTQDGVRWTPPPSDHLGYFANSNARDPRPDLVHEGVPGHYLQLWLSWHNSDPIRRHYYDSGANEGLGFYAEEMMLHAGLFDDSPRTREIIYNYMRLRALRVEVDVKLALGEFTLDQAASFLAKMVPMDARTARSEAAMFATTPGQAISYQAGKLQITKFLADARQEAGSRFDIKRFNDFLWTNGNVPIELQRREWFGSRDGLIGSSEEGLRMDGRSPPKSLPQMGQAAIKDER